MHNPTALDVLIAGACIALASALTPCAQAAVFTDTFSSAPADMDRSPFAWNRITMQTPAGQGWSVTDGILEYRTREGRAGGAHVLFTAAGIQITDATSWSVEVGFRHLGASALRPGYETLCYVTWPTDAAGQMRILAVMYDAAQSGLITLNGNDHEEPAQADLTGPFHKVRLTVEGLQGRVYVDNILKVGPFVLNARAYYQEPAFYIGPITGGDDQTLAYQFDYFAFTSEGAYEPGAEPQWRPDQDTAPVAEGLKVVRQPLNQEPYPGITVLKPEKGSGPWDRAIPQHWRKLRQIIADQPGQLETTLYDYGDKRPAPRQNIYRNYQCLRYDEKRCVAISHLTRGIDDTGPGFMDYKLWYRVSTDGGETYDEERPLIQTGGEYSPMHPIEYVWIGKNSFCYASIPPFVRMSNGQVLMPIYYAPLDEEGNYYNPVGAFTFTNAGALIGTWNEQGDDLTWQAGQSINLSGEQSSRGANECAVVELGEPGHILMVIRGSNQNDRTGKTPAIKWKTLSTDYGKTWSDCTPFIYSDDEQFWSPSSCSSFIRSSITGKAYWVGNISRVPPRANHPRYPLVIGELDEETLSLRKETVTIVDDRGPADPPDLQLSNFRLLEDPETGHLVARLNRYMPASYSDKPGYGVHTYIIQVK